MISCRLCTTLIALAVLAVLAVLAALAVRSALAALVPPVALVAHLILLLPRIPVPQTFVDPFLSLHPILELLHRAVGPAGLEGAALGL